MQTKRGEPNEQAEQEPEPAGSAESAAESEPAESEKRSAERLIFFLSRWVCLSALLIFIYLLKISEWVQSGRLGGPPHLRRRAQGWTPRFPPLWIPFPLFLSLAQTRDRRPLRKRGTTEDFSSHKDGPTSGPSFSFTYSQFGYPTATHTVQSTLSAA